MSISRVSIVVLGGKVLYLDALDSRRSHAAKASPSLAGALGRRVEAARLLYFSYCARGAREGDGHSDEGLSHAPLVIVSGGSTWNGVVEADAMADALVLGGVPRDAIVRDRLSLTTRENARYSAIALTRRGHDEAVLVTCAWHLPRATRAFELEGVRVIGHPVEGPEITRLGGLWRWGRERVVGRLERLLVVGALYFTAAPAATAAATLGCSKASTGNASDAASDASVEGAAATLDTSAIRRAEDQRRAKDVPDAARTSHEVLLRRLAARAYARIADDASIAGLVRALEDEDPETAAWGAYGLGATCKGHEDAHVRALAARAASLPASDGGGAPSSPGIDPRGAVARALGRCGGEVAERVLASWMKDARADGRERAAFALGDVAAKRNALGDEATTALLEAAAGSAGVAPFDAALYPFGRIDHPSEAFADRVLQAARAALSRPSQARVFAIRALGRIAMPAVDSPAPDLVRVAKDKSFTPAERAEAAHALGKLGKDGRGGAAEALAYLVPEKDPVGIGALAGDEFGVMTSLLSALGVEAPKKSEASLSALANLALPANASPSLARRVTTLRCTAASILSRAAYDSDVLKKCDLEGASTGAPSEAFERARLTSLVERHALNGERRAAWLALARSKYVRVREAALEAIGQHPELGEHARTALAEALSSKKPGVVAIAAEQIHAHPDRVFLLAAREIRAALDPNNHEPPSANPARELDGVVAKALSGALEHPWPEDLVETRAALIDAAMTVGLAEAKDAALAACHDPNATMRQRATKALMSVADVVAVCTPPETPASVAAEIGHELTKPTTVRFDTDAGPLAIRFDPVLTPIASTRFVALARAGFFDGIVVHRVVPGFVVQLGDPGGDGYGGAGKLLRCETAPVAFEPFDVGVALAGRDTGSSQLFVTLARTPHLDGEYAHVGHAEGDWSAVAEGDIVRSAKVDE
jgi:cyclophilin family peptidyl-prolyl cis-trans isomerase/uncharacterized SAM-binding protein YcdF (DUF218 family)